MTILRKVVMKMRKNKKPRLSHMLLSSSHSRSSHYSHFQKHLHTKLLLNLRPGVLPIRNPTLSLRTTKIRLQWT
jgi:hypothetical protein